MQPGWGTTGLKGSQARLRSLSLPNKKQCSERHLVTTCSAWGCVLILLQKKKKKDANVYMILSKGTS